MPLNFSRVVFYVGVLLDLSNEIIFIITYLHLTSVIDK